jgi:Putative MetA-pathway of phenol degradation
MKIQLQLIIPLLLAGALQAQTTTDGLLMPKNNFCTGIMASHDSWKNYWEGTLKRDNENLGTVTTNSLTWFGNFGVSEKLNIIAAIPYVMTKASGGTLHGMQGVQDLSIAIKYKFFQVAFDSSNKFRAFVVGSLGSPLSDYTPDYLPLSIGLASKQATGRLNLNYYMKPGFYVNGTIGYTFRSNVELDRPSYFADGKIYYTNEVDMPNVLDFALSVGYVNRGWETKLSYIQQNTQGGGDIRRQDMPFVSYRMNFSKAEALVMYYLPRPKYFALRAAYTHTLAGRNVGQSSMLMGGILYTFHFAKH